MLPDMSLAETAAVLGCFIPDFIALPFADEKFPTPTPLVLLAAVPPSAALPCLEFALELPLVSYPFFAFALYEANC